MAAQACRLLPLTPVVVALGALALSNPGPGDFNGFAGERLTILLTKEVCRGSALPLLLTVLAHDCPTLLRSQQPVLAAMASARSERLNLGLFSLYRTRLGGDVLFNHWRLPTYSVLTLAAAGQFFVLQTEVDGRVRAGEGRP
jgi:hypothetical protein